MATYKVKAPDGRVITVEGPAGASQAQIIAQAQKLTQPVAQIQAESLERPSQPDMLPMLTSMQGRPGVRERGPLEAAMISAGSVPERLISGARLGYEKLFGDPEKAKRIEAEREVTGELLEPLESQHPKATFAGGMLPYFAIPGSLVSTLPRAVATGAGVSGLESGLDPLQTGIGAVSGAGGYKVGQYLGGLLSRQRPPEGSTPWTQQLAGEGKDLGLRLTPAQATESQALKIAERSARSSPFAAGSFQKLDDANQSAANRIAGRAIGEDTDQLTPDVLSDATRRIGNQFKELTSNKEIPLGDEFLDDLARIEAVQTGKWGRKDAMIGYIDDALEEASKGAITGKRYQELRSSLGKEAKRQMTSQQGDREIGLALFDLLDSLDNAAARVMTQAERQAFDVARREWGHLRTLTDTSIVNEQGNVSLLKLANKLRSKDTAGYSRGGITGIGTPTQDLYTAARWAQSFKQPGTSQTAERLSMPLNWMGAFATGGTLIPGMMALGKSMTMPYPWQTGLLGLPAGTRDVLARTGSLAGLGATTGE